MSRTKTRRSLRTGTKNKWTPLWLVLSGVGLIAVALWALIGANSPRPVTIEVTGAPALTVDQEVLDYGDVKLGQTVRATVRVTNVGDQTLRFTEAPYVEVLEGC